MTVGTGRKESVDGNVRPMIVIHTLQAPGSTSAHIVSSMCSLLSHRYMGMVPPPKNMVTMNSANDAGKYPLQIVLRNILIQNTVDMTDMGSGMDVNSMLHNQYLPSANRLFLFIMLISSLHSSI